MLFPQQRGSVLLIVLWVTFGLVSVALYFGHAMFLEYRAADNNAAGIEAEQAIEGAARHISYALTNSALPGQMPDPLTYGQESVPLGNATFWLIGRTNLDNQISLIDAPPAFGLVDEASKLNLNTATLEMLQQLPRMTPNFAAAIIDWRDTNEEAGENGAEAEVYQRLNTPYACKNANFETVEELRLIYGADPDILIGEDYNRNGVLDPNENDGDLTPPYDNRDGRLDPGLFEYLTVFSRESNVRTNGAPRISVNNGLQADLTQLLQEVFGSDATQIQGQLQRAMQAGGAGTATNATFGSVLEFFVRSGMTAEQFTRIESDLTVTNATFVDGLVNVNTASAAVLACIPGIGPDKAQQVVGFRQSQGQGLTGIAWLAQVLDQASAIQAGPYLTSRSYQFSADIAAVGHHGRGFRRVVFVIDTTETAPKILYRRDLGRLGWALGATVQRQLALAKELRNR